jgi:hypothetical protein
MNKKIMKILASVLLFSMTHHCSESLFAQDAKDAASAEKFVYYYATFSKFKPGKIEEGRDFIYNHFWTVDKAIGRKPLAFDFLTGPWDHLVFFRLEGGLADAEIGKTAQVKKWQAEFEKQEGGLEKATEAQAGFDAMVDKSISGLFKIPLEDVEQLEASYSFLSEEKYFRVIMGNHKPGKNPAAQALLLNEFRPARKATGRLVAPFFTVAGSYDVIAFFEIDPSGVDNIVSDSKDLALAEEMGGDEKMKEMSSKYADYLRNLSREVAVARW